MKLFPLQGEEMRIGYVQKLFGPPQKGGDPRHTVGVLRIPGNMKKTQSSEKNKVLPTHILTQLTNKQFTEKSNF